MAPGSASKQRDYDYLFKLVLIGDSGVGKSCLLLRFAVSVCDPKPIGDAPNEPPQKQMTLGKHFQKKRTSIIFQ